MGKQINQYTKTRTAATIQGDDLLGPDSTEDTGTTFESAKMKVSELLAYINANVDNLYRIDGSLTGSRNVTLDSHTLSFVQGKIRFKSTGGDIPFSLDNSSGVERVKLEYGTTLDSGSLTLSNTAGDFFSAIDGEIYFFTKKLFTYYSPNNRVQIGEGFDQMNLQAVSRVNCVPAFHVTTINSAGGGSATNIVLGSNAISYKGSNSTASGVNHYFNTNSNVSDVTNNLLIVANFGVNHFNFKSNGILGIGTEAPEASSKLDITSTTQGFLTPRMTTTQKNAISSPVEGLEVYDLTLSKKCFYNGSAWETITSS
tara:strand:+ start:18040 stop:18978 length:939 start_codon:yes stop_codon:yes gene_type:complete